MTNDSMSGWHWLRSDRRLRYRDGRLVEDGEVVEAGKTYVAEGPLRICRNGMHASKRALDALERAPGPIICRVRLEGELQHDNAKSVGRSRTVLWMADATTVLHEFALWSAKRGLLREQAASRETDYRCWVAIEIKQRWVWGDASDAELSMARIAARDAVSDIARCNTGTADGTAAWAAARAVWASTGTSALEAAWGTALSAAWSATDDAAKTAIWDELNAELERRLMALAPAEVT